MNRPDLYPSRCGAAPGITERLDPVVYARDWLRGPLNQSQVSAYDRDGFLLLENFFSAAEIAEFVLELERLRHDPQVRASEATITERSSQAVRSIFRVHEDSPVFTTLARDERLIDIARFLLDDEVYIHQSRLNYKPGFRGKEFYWHSDFETWHVEDGMPRMRALSMSITLTDNHSCNGPLLLIPGSHRHFVICAGETPAQHFKSSLKKQEYGVPDDASLTRLVEQGGIVEATGKAGSLIIFDCNAMHGSNGNITPFPRSNAFFVYNAVSNRVGNPFSGQAPRPGYICTRE
jgi:ectoine hydroxylase